MILGEVRGSVHASVKSPELADHRLLLVRPIGLEGEPLGKEFVAVDTAQAGSGERVLCIKEGSSARLLFKNPKIPVQYVIVAVVDGLEVER